MTDKPSENERSNRLNPAVFHGSVAGIVIFLVYATVFTEHATAFFNAGLSWVGSTFGWYYMLAIVAYLVFVVLIGVSRFGRIRLGPDHSRPEFSLLSWTAMLFAAGLGGAILFFVVSEPLTHYLNPPIGDGGAPQAQRRAIVQTFMHWGISGWGLYVLMGMALAYFSYRHRLPLAIRSTLYPLLGKRIYGPIGDVVDITAVLAIVFGIATALGIGVIQMNYGLTYLFGVPEGLTAQILLIVLVVTMATLSVVTGVDKGIRRLSEFNLLLVVGVVLFVLFQGDTLHLLNALVLNTGDYLVALIGKSFDTYAYAPQAQSWFNGWTVFFWGWWIAWAPFVGLFLARISRGRTIREFVAGALFIPLVFVMVMMSVFGNSGIDMVDQGLVVLGEQAIDMPQATIYTFLEQLPWVGVTAGIVTLLSIVFFVTSADSGALVLSNFTYILRDVNHDAPVRLRVFWSTIIGLITVALLMAGGLKTLQSAVVITALPFSVVIFLTMIGMYRSLKVEVGKADARRQVASSGAAGSDWRERLDRTLDGSTHDGAQATLRHAIRPALVQLAEELAQRGQHATVTEQKMTGSEMLCPSLRVDFDGAPSFIYQIRPHRMQTPSFLPADDDYYLRLDVHLTEGGLGQDLNGYTRLQVIHDVLNEYQRHLRFLAQASENGSLETIPGHAVGSVATPAD
ncbi:choline/glycine/proline betaine transport protein [Modicisalibacter muralis]|uniref:Choline/glycine/proline betaine transport protein n=1 Tax=Modicisalibacter muralis TaxID=119000 RepID=A0A1G9P8B1_9GAMM|nr:choline BCCT transporter BetT [Halomonas muralis]SDL94783.1 choline/glycine/proline betaine transport protein [Halomonas muralis]